MFLVIIDDGIDLFQIIEENVEDEREYELGVFSNCISLFYI